MQGVEHESSGDGASALLRADGARELDGSPAAAAVESAGSLSVAWLSVWCGGALLSVAAVADSLSSDSSSSSCARKERRMEGRCKARRGGMEPKRGEGGSEDKMEPKPRTIRSIHPAEHHIRDTYIQCVWGKRIGPHASSTQASVSTSCDLSLLIDDRF